MVASERGFGSAGGTPPMAPYLCVQMILSSAVDTNVILKKIDHFIVAACLFSIGMQEATDPRTPDLFWTAQ